MMIAAKNLSLLLLLLSPFARAAASSFRGNTSARERHLAEVSLGLIDVSKNTKILDLTNGAVLNLSDLPSSYNVVAALPAKMSVKNVVFRFSGTPSYMKESRAPYALCGDEGGMFLPCPAWKVGRYTLSVTPSGRTAYTVAFTVVDGPVNPTASAPVPSPPPPVPAPNALAPVVVPTPAVPVPSPTAPVVLTPPAPVSSPITPVVPSPHICGIPKLLGTGWQSAGPKHPESLIESQGALLAGTHFCIVSGFVGTIDQCSKSTYCKDVRDPNSSWIKQDDLTDGLSIEGTKLSEGLSHAGHTVVGSKLYLCGGYFSRDPGQAMKDCLVFDLNAPRGSQWKAITSLPAPRGGGGLVYSASENKLIFAGGAIRPTVGAGKAVDQKEAWAYDLGQGLTGTWVPLANFPYLANHLSFAKANDENGQEHIYFLNGQLGQNQQSGNIDLVYEYSFASSAWIQRKSSDLTRGHASSSTFGYGCGLITIAGSTNGVGTTGDISYYDIPTNTWTSIGNLDDTANTPVCIVYKDLSNADWIHCESPRSLSRKRQISSS